MRPQHRSPQCGVGLRCALQVCLLWTRAGKLLLLSNITVFIHKGSKKRVFT